MPTYRGHADRPDQAKALAAVVGVHVLLGAVILVGLNVETVTRAVERLKTFDITQDAPPPPVEQPPPVFEDSAAPEEEAAPANIRSKPTPLVAPPSRITPPIPLPTSEVRGPEGSDRTAGAAATPGSGTGAGGHGTGYGGGGSGGTGSGAGDGRSPAYPLNKIPNRDYRRIAGGRIPRGSAAMSFRVDPSGRIADCRIVRSSGDPVVDSNLCPLAVQRLRFQPALDAQRRPIPYFVNRYVLNWDVG